jgi:uncharacterized protein YoxC
MKEMDVLHIVLVVLVVAGIWVLVELALVVRKTRSTVGQLSNQVSEIARNANDTIEQLQPMLDKVDGMMTDLEPAVEQVQPLLEKTGVAIDMVTVDLASVNDILVEVSSVTDTASNVTSAVSKAANSAVSGVAGVVEKFTGGGKPSRRNRLAEKSNMATRVAKRIEPRLESAQEGAPSAPETEVVEQKTYFTYDNDAKDE